MPGELVYLFIGLPIGALLAWAIVKAITPKDGER